MTMSQFASTKDYWQDRAEMFEAELARLKPLSVKERADLLACIEFSAHKLEGARSWNGMGWSYGPLHPLHYKPALERLRSVLAQDAAALKSTV
jgi:hypothetical protein